VTNLRLPGQYDERLFAAAGISGLQGPYQNWHRWYLPTLGRYMELDPIALAGGFNAPFAPSWYAYVEGSPLRHSDPLGLTWEYCIDTGELRYVPNNGEAPESVAHGYAGIIGYQSGLEAILANLWPDVGPLPMGLYNAIGPLGNHRTQRGVLLIDSMRLTQLPGTDMGPLDRSGFLIHGGDMEARTSSTGCPIFTPQVRKRIAASGDRLFRVVRCR
jgi:RHS repeat-associated protein